jgi:hypothetical protein
VKEYLNTSNERANSDDIRFFSRIIILTVTPLQMDKLQSVLGYFMTLPYSRPSSAPMNFMSRFYTLFINSRFLLNSIAMAIIKLCFSFHCLFSTDSVSFCRKYRSKDYLTNCLQIQTKYEIIGKNFLNKFLSKCT